MPWLRGLIAQRGSSSKLALAFGLTCSLALAISPAVFAQSEASRASARALGTEGIAALERKEYRTALDRFERAETMFHAPTLVLGIARSKAGLGNLLGAKESYEKVLQERLEANAPEAFVRARREADQEYKSLISRIPTLTIQLDGPSDAVVSLDGRPVARGAVGVGGSIGTSIPADPGSHVVRASKEGWTSVERFVQLAERAQEKVVIVLSPPAAPPPSAWIASGPAISPSRPAPGATNTPWQKTAGYVALGVGGFGLVAGAIGGAVALVTHNKLEQACGADHVCPPSQADNLDQFHALGTVSTVSFIVGGVGAALAIPLLVLAPAAQPGESAPTKTRASLNLAISPTYLGLAGQF